VAACLTGKDWSKVHRLPDLPGEKPEVIIQVMQRNYYELMIRLAGAKLVEVGLGNGTKAWHLESAITERTAAIVHFVAYSPPTDLPIETVIEIGHQRGVPVIVDVAAAFPPFSELRRCTDTGADLAIFSGGKALRGLQSSGLVLGRRDLIEACAMNGSPFHGIGRPMEVGKEEIVALVNAVELWSNPEFERRQLAAWEERTDTFIKLMSDVRGVRVYRGDSPPASSGRAINPGWLQVAHVEWDQTVIPKTVQAACDELRQGEPGIIVPALRTGMMVSPQCLEPGEEVILAQRIKQVLRGQSG
jgi:D-glucosaminate-6-phosphate ammonia-lyase